MNCTIRYSPKFIQCTWINVGTFACDLPSSLCLTLDTKFPPLEAKSINFQDASPILQSKSMIFFEKDLLCDSKNNWQSYKPQTWRLQATLQQIAK